MNKPSDFTIKYLAHRDVFVGYMHGRIVVTKKSEADVQTWFCKQGTNVTLPKTTKTTKKVVVNPIHAKLEAQTADVWRNAMQLFPATRTMLIPKVEFFSRGTVAGKAYYSQHKVTFNEVLAAENENEFNNTVIHEVAHLVTRKLYPFAKAHGREFKSVMRALGGNGERCHSYDVSSVKVTRNVKKYVYSCSCQEHKVGGKIHNKMSVGANYKCRKCGSSIKFTGKVV